MSGVTACTGMRVWLPMLGIMAALPAWAQNPPAPRPDVRGQEGQASDTGMADIENVADTSEERPWNIGVPEATRRAARELFYQGNQLAEGQFFASAAHRYQAALATWKHPAIFYNLALVQLGLQKPIEAYGSFQQAVQHGAEPLGRSKHEEALRHLQELRQALAHVEIICEQHGADVTLNGSRLFVGPGRYRGVLEPGLYHLAARTPGAVADVRQVVLSAGHEVQYELVVRQWAAERRFAPWVPWVVMGAGTATALAGGYSHKQAISGLRRIDQEIAARCTQTRGCLPTPPEIVADLDRADRLWTTAVIGYVAGGALMTAGAVLLYLNRERTVLHEARGSQAAAAIVPVLTPEMWGVSAELQF